MAKAASKSSPQRKYLLQAGHFRCFYVFPVRPPQKLQVQAKIPTIRPVFADNLSLSYDMTMFQLTMNIGILQSSNYCRQHVPTHCQWCNTNSVLQAMPQS